MQINDFNATGFDSVIEPSMITKIANEGGANPTLIEKTIAENGTYNASDDNADGYSSVTVDVTGGSRVDFAALIDRSITSVTIPSNITSIGSAAFAGCTQLTEITIPSNITIIEPTAFLNCTGLTEVTIPSSVTSIDEYAFTNCTNLETITINKAEGSITGAPWGATNATVVWNG